MTKVPREKLSGPVRAAKLLAALEIAIVLIIAVSAGASSADTNQGRGAFSLSLDVRPEFGAVAAGDTRIVQFLTRIKAPHFVNEKRAGVDLVVVVDRSYSMSGQPIELVRETLDFVVRQLGPNDRLSVVSYGSDVTTVFGLQRMDEEGRLLAASKVSQIQVNGMTNLSGGLLRGVEILEGRPASERNEVASILLLTDGHANEGLTDASEIVEACHGRRRDVGHVGEIAGSFSGSINTFGFGSDHDSRFLSTISEASGGVFYFIENADKVADAFADCLGGLVSTTSQHLEIDFAGVSGATIEALRTRFPHEKREDGRVRVAVADMQSDETREFLVSVKIPAASTVTERFGALEVKMRYYNTIERQQEELLGLGFVSRPDSVDYAAQKIDLAVNVASNREKAAAAMESSANAGDSGDLEAASEALSEAMEDIENSPSASEPFSAALIKDLSELAKMTRTKQDYDNKGRQSLSASSASHSLQRKSVAGSAMEASDLYGTLSRDVLKEKKDKHFAGGSS
jgi:von Willebrand factor type A domain